jgi:L-2-hydroxyglutarate oxidase LhgO
VTTADIVVVGAGVVGLAVADALLAERPELRVVVLDKEAELARHASGRNSGVLHAGFYYSPDSLKAQLVRRGNELLHQFCDEQGIPVRRCGKVVVAQSESQVSTLTQLFERGRANGVPLELIDELQLHELEPRARTMHRAIWSPTTSVADPVAVVRALADRVKRRGGEVRLGSPVTRAMPGRVVTSSGEISTGHVVNAAGLYADAVANWFGMCDDYVVLPFKGLYWYGSVPDGWLKRLVYPVPDPRNPFLGVHLTITADGHTKVGPTAIPAGKREDDSRRPTLSLSETPDIVRSYGPFVRSPHHDVSALLRAEVPKYSRRYLLRQVARLVDGVSPSDFKTPGRPGVRAQLLHKESGRLEMDFVVRGDEHSTHVLNAVSPAWTSSLSFGAYIAGTVLGSGFQSS